MPLLIVESPAKCSKIKGFLGPSWTVIATMGHIRALEEELDAVGIERDFEPRYRFIKEKNRAIEGIKEAADGLEAKEIYLASDDDREGEMISYAVCVLLKLNADDTPRTVFREITKKAVCDAVANPRRIDMNRVLAQQSRAMLDLMVGYTISPVLWKHVGRGLSAGRCQTVALRLVYDREQEIKNFKSATSYRISGDWTCGDVKFSGKMVEDLEDVDSVRNYLENVYDDTASKIMTVVKKDWSTGSPKPLMTSTLQQEASSLFNIKPKACMMIAQKLYEEGYITYMRTDQETMSDEAVQEAKALVDGLWGKDYISEVKKVVKAAKAPKAAKTAKAVKVEDVPQAQEAHEAIRPTKFDKRELPADFDAAGKKIYRLIWEHAVCSVMEACRGERVVVEYVILGDPNEFLWESEWSKTLFWGWKIVAGKQKEDVELFKKVSGWRSGDRLDWSRLVGEPHTTKAVGRFTEASLVKELEKKGIGRPSTFAALISTIEDKKYVEVSNKEARKEVVDRLIVTGKGVWPPVEEKLTKNVGAERDKLTATDLGSRVVEFALKEFGSLFDYGFTATMEKKLDEISKGGLEWKSVLKETWGSYEEKYKELLGSSEAAPADGKVKDFGGGLKAVYSARGPVLLREGEPSAQIEEAVPAKRGRGGKGRTARPAPEASATFYGWPEGVRWEEMDEARALEFIEAGGNTVGTWNGEKIVKKAGKFGSYAECSGVRITLKDGMTEAEIISALEKKQKESAAGRVIGNIEVRVGPYGPYMFQKNAKKKDFVSVPKGLNLDLVTEREIDLIFANGLRAKVASRKH